MRDYIDPATYLEYKALSIEQIGLKVQSIIRDYTKRIPSEWAEVRISLADDGSGKYEKYMSVYDHSPLHIIVSTKRDYPGRNGWYLLIDTLFPRYENKNMDQFLNRIYSTLINSGIMEENIDIFKHLI